MSSKIIFTIFTFTSALTLHYIVSLIFSVVVCSSGCFQGPPLPNKPFITVWNTPTDRCEPEWNVSLDLSAFDIVVNKDQKWCGEYIVIFYHTQLGLYPYFDSNGKAFNGEIQAVGNAFVFRQPKWQSCHYVDKTRQDKTRQCFILSRIQCYVYRLYPNNLKL